MTTVLFMTANLPLLTFEQISTNMIPLYPLPFSFLRETEVHEQSKDDNRVPRKSVIGATPFLVFCLRSLRPGINTISHVVGSL